MRPPGQSRIFHLRGEIRRGRLRTEPFDGSLTANLRHPGEAKASDDELCGCGGKLDVRPSRHAAAVRAELRNASNRSDNESTSVRSRRCGSGHPVRVFHDIGCTLSWLPAFLYATCALGWLDCAASGRDHGTWPGKQCLTRLLEHGECLPDGERDAMIGLHAMTPALGAALQHSHIGRRRQRGAFNGFATNRVSSGAETFQSCFESRRSPDRTLPFAR